MTLKYVCTVKSGPGPLNISFGSDMPITLLHLMLISKIYVVNSDMKNVICMSDPNVMFKGPGPKSICKWQTFCEKTPERML